ncbi:MAG: proprotein convertase P-domain-containing protein [Parasphingopyxis sp.]
MHSRGIIAQIRAFDFSLVALKSWLCLCAAFIGSFFAVAAHAQTTVYTNSTDGAVNETATPCSASGYLVRNFSVGTSYTVSDVDIGVLLAHSYRGDLLMYLQSPSGTRVQIFTGTGNGASNFNVRMDGSAGTSVTTHTADDTATAGTTVPPYQRSFAPANALSAFNGQNSQGTWRLEICDRYNQDSGNFYQADLFLTQIPTNYADLSLSKSVSNSSPANGTSITYTLSLTNAGSSPQTATAVTIADSLPLGVSYSSHSGYGSYDSGSGTWTVPSIAPGQTRTLTITATVTATSGATVTNTAEVSASSVADIDSTPGNGDSSEDDYDTATFTVSGTRTAGTPPSLSAVCLPINQTLFDWNTRSWTAGALNASYDVTNIGTIIFDISTNGTFVNSTPDDTSSNTGGFGGTQQALYQYLEYSNRDQVATTVLTLPTAVPGLQFTVFDIDFAANDFADKLTVTGTFNGAPVMPVLTNGIANYVMGNVAIGDAGSGGTSADGNVVVTFLSPVDTVTIVYGNHITAPADPDGQAASIYDFNFCNPETTLSVTKISSLISDPVNNTADPYAIPGAVIEYCILISNPGSATATSVTATDSLPANITYTAGSLNSGPNCAAATTAEDDDATGADESDPFGASVSGTTITATAASLGPSAAFALKFRATVD